MHNNPGWLFNKIFAEQFCRNSVAGDGSGDPVEGIVSKLAGLLVTGLCSGHPAFCRQVSLLPAHQAIGESRQNDMVL